MFPAVVFGTERYLRERRSAPLNGRKYYRPTALSPCRSFVSNLFLAGNFRRLVPGSVTFDPCRQYRNDISLFFGRQLPSGRDAVPLGQTPPAAAGRGMLGDKDRMPAHRGLPPVIGNNGRSETRAYEIRSVTPDSFHAFSLDIGDIFRFQTKSPAEPGCRQPGEQRIEGFRRMGIFNHFSPQIKSAGQRYEQPDCFYPFGRDFRFGYSGNRSSHDNPMAASSDKIPVVRSHAFRKVSIRMPLKRRRPCWETAPEPCRRRSAGARV